MLIWLTSTLKKYYMVSIFYISCSMSKYYFRFKRRQCHQLYTHFTIYFVKYSKLATLDVEASHII